MRYRPFGHFDVSVSALSLALPDNARMASVEDWVALIYMALESGVNSFEIQGRHGAIIEALDRALEHVERRLVFISWRLGPNVLPESFAGRAFTAQTIDAALQSLLARGKLGYVDMVMLDDPGVADLSTQALEALKDFRAKGLTRFIGVGGRGEAIDAYISTGAFDALALPYNMTSGWMQRLRMRAAQEHEMAVIGYDFCPDTLLPSPPVEARRSLWSKRPAPAQARPYDFLAQTPNWSAREICLAYALTEPTLATVQAAVGDLDTLQALASATDRQMPPGLAAQIEMARIVAGVDGGPHPSQAHSA